jgi:ATP-dependent DNA ligase
MCKLLLEVHEKDPVKILYTIRRITGQYGGKETSQPDLIITEGKVKRTAEEQASLQFNSLLKQYLDKGYVNLATLTSKKYEELKEDEIKSLLGTTVSDQAGIPKPMLAKLADDCSSDIWNKDWWVSRKLDGVRLLMYYKDGKIHTASRGGGTYDPATKHLREDPELLKIFAETPDLILDGELYHHGNDWPLQRISGLARQQEWKEECQELQYWIYDYISSAPFKDRVTILSLLRSKFENSDSIKIVEHIKINGYLSAKKLHDKFVQEGFEGLCARNPEKEYGINKRSALYLIKLKERKDDEAEIIGIKEGLRPEDMCFTLKTENGIEFKAKPMGSRELKDQYRQDIDELIGKMATVKFFYYSDDGTPLQPVLKAIRDYE